MVDYDSLLQSAPFGMCQSEKDAYYQNAIDALSRHHAENCAEYRKLYDRFGAGVALPVRLFKEYQLKSIPDQDVRKTMTSSGTTGQSVSRIYLDAASATRQTKVLARIVGDFLGPERRPMLVLDTSAVLKDRKMFSARGAGILGFSMFGHGTKYALDENMELDLDGIAEFCEKHKGKQVLLFGFTFMVWQYVVLALKEKNIRLDLEGALIHGGGWKKLAQLAVDDEAFRAAVGEWIGVDTVLNYYGMVEQTGSIYMQCPCGRLHASVFSDIDVIDPGTMQKKSEGSGLIQTTSLLPTSYPGHVLLTEDVGEITGVDDCPCGRKGKTFAVYGRIAGAEIRGCSDTYEKR